MEVEVETGAGRQARGPIFSVGERLCICNAGRRVETSSVVEGVRPGCDRARAPWPPPRPQYWNIDTTSLYAAFAERTACFFRPSARPPAIAVQLQDCAVIEGH